VDVENDENDRTRTKEYARSKAKITVVTFLHKQVFQTHAMVLIWHKPCQISVLEHMAQGCVLWLEAKTCKNVSISIVNVHRTTANKNDLQQKVNYLLIVMIYTTLT